MKKIHGKIMFALFSLIIFSAILGLGVGAKLGFNENQSTALAVIVFIGTTAFAMAQGKANYEGANQNMAYAISYTSPTVITGEIYEEVMMEILYANNTLNRKLVRFIENVKANIPIRTLSVAVSDQAYTSGAPTSLGTLTPGDKLITPVKRQFYQEFDYEALRGTAHGQDMAAGAYNIISDEFASNVMSLLGPKQGLAIESRFWNGATGATQTAVAALTPGAGQGLAGAAEQTYVASLTAGPVDGIITKLIYNTGAVGARYKVAGTTLSASSIKTEIDKVYVQISPKLLQAQNLNDVRIYMPYNCLQFINAYNSTATNFKDIFVPQSDGTFKYNGIQLEFVPLPSNCMLAALWYDIVWATDLLDDQSNVKVDRLANNREDYFAKTIYTMESWVFNQSDKVLYLG